MKLPRIYSIQAKLSAVFLFVVILIICSGMLSVYFSKRHLKTASFFTDIIAPDIQRINDLQQAASRVENDSRQLSQAVTRYKLVQVHEDLENTLVLMSGLTTTITQEDNGIDIVSLNFLTQAIRSHAQLVFQLRAERLKMALDQQRISREIQRHLIRLVALEAPRDNHSPSPGLLTRSLPLLDALNIPAATPLNIRQLKGDFAAFHRENARAISEINAPKIRARARAVLDLITELMGSLLELKQAALDINQRIGKFITTLDRSTARLILMTGQYIHGVRDRFRENAQQALKREKQNIHLTNGGLCFPSSSFICCIGKSSSKALETD